MNITEEVKGDVVIIRLDGRLDATSSPQLEAKVNELIEQKQQKLILSLQNVDYLSSAGMRVLLSITKKIKSISGKLMICSLTDDVMDIIKMAGFNQILPISASEEKAIQEI